MDDNSICSQMPEVCWDCDSPSPNTWKRCQGSSIPTTVEKHDGKMPTLPLQKELIKRPRDIFRIDSKSLDKAQTIIDQLKRCNHETENKSSLDKIFDQSGGHEELASPPLTLMPMNGKPSSDNGHALPTDFWNDAIFNQGFVDDSSNFIGAEEHSKPSQTETRTSTPVRDQPRRKSLNLKRRQLDVRNKQSFNETTPSKENRSPCNGISGSPVCSGVRCAAKEMAKSSLFHTADNAAVSHPPTKLKKLSHVVNGMVVESGTASKQSIEISAKKKRPQTEKAAKPKQNNISISDDILTLMMDDSWTVKCTNGPSHIDQLQNEISVDDQVLTQIFMDDSWTETCSQQIVTKDNIIYRSDDTKASFQQPKPLNVTPTLPPNDDLDLPNAVHSQSSEDLDPTQPVSPQLQNNPLNCHNNPNPISNGLKYKFKAKSTALTPPSGSSTTFLPKCTAAEIEQKRLRALQRKKERSKCTKP